MISTAGGCQLDKAFDPLRKVGKKQGMGEAYGTIQAPFGVGIRFQCFLQLNASGVVVGLPEHVVFDQVQTTTQVGSLNRIHESRGSRNMTNQQQQQHTVSNGGMSNVIAHTQRCARQLQK